MENIEEKNSRGPDKEIIFITSNGYGIKTSLKEFRKASRGGKGTRAVSLNEKNGKLVAAKVVNDGQTIVAISKNGQAALFPIDQINLKGRGISGVRFMGLEDGDCIVDVVIA